MSGSTNLDGDMQRSETAASGSGTEAYSGDAGRDAMEPRPRIEARAGAPGLQALVAYMWRLSLGDEVGHVPFKPVPSDL